MIVLDFNEDKVQTTSVDSSNIYLKYDNTGFKAQTGWISPEDGFLALDSNNNEKIDDILELFGDKDISGFDELKTYDKDINGVSDGVIDLNDTICLALLNAHFEYRKLYQISLI